MTDAPPVRYARRGAVALVCVDTPPVNALGQAVRQGLLGAMDRAETDPYAEAVVLYGAGQNFIAGADIREFGQMPRAPSLPEVCNRIEASPLLVVAVLHGVALGGGLEIALAADYRVARPEAEVGLPEVSLGLIPGAGGTQRLPRVTGVDAALDLITTGRRIGAPQAKALGIVDEISTGAPLEIGHAFATDLLARNARRRPVCAASPPEPIDWHPAEVDVRRRARGQIAPIEALRAVRASVDMPFEDGLAEERRIFDSLMGSDQRQAMIHLFFAERAASRLPEIENVSVRKIQSVGIVGGGTMGAGIASAVLLAGLSVTVVETSDAAAETARDRIAQNLEGAAQRGKMTSAGYEMALGQNLILASRYSALSDCDMVIEAVFEDMAVKKTVFEQLDRHCKKGAVLATNTSYLDIVDIAKSTKRAEDVLGLHFFSPAHVMKLLEIVVPDGTSLDVVATGFAFAKKLGKRAVRAGVGEGFIGNRILSAFRAAADQIALAGATPQEVDSALESFGFAMGPYAAADLAGLDIRWAMRKRLAPFRDPREQVARFPDGLCEAGHFGRKTGTGYYLYNEGTFDAKPNPKVLSLIETERQMLGITPKSFRSEQITDRIMAAMVNEAARVVEEGVARRPLDVDVVMTAGYGFPRHRGGPCKWADLKGLRALLSEMETYAKEDSYFWRPVPLLQKLVREGRVFGDLNEIAKT